MQIFVLDTYINIQFNFHCNLKIRYFSASYFTDYEATYLKCFKSNNTKESTTTFSGEEYFKLLL